MSASPLTDLLSPATLAGIDGYALLARLAVEGFVSGLHRSLYHGFGAEFYQYRNYVKGDDLKYVDWKMFARRNKFYTKVFQQETNMDCVILVDASASMSYRGEGAPCSKLHYACMLAACLAYLANRQGDNVGFYAYNEQVVSAVPPGGRPGHLSRIFTELSRLEPAGEADHGHALSFVAETCRHRGLVIVLSDLLEATDTVIPLLKRFRFAHHDCILFQVLDPDEVQFPFNGTARFQDLETSAEITTVPQSVRTDYLKGMQDFLADLRQQCEGSQASYHLCTSDANLGAGLGAFLHQRETMA
jgi:uncharacterized protein (DUF58 family)